MHDMSTQDRVDHVTEARLYVRDVTSTCFRRRYTLFAENTVAVVTKDVDLDHSMTLLSPDSDVVAVVGVEVETMLKTMFIVLLS